MSDAADVIAALTSRGEPVATAESLTGGLVCAALSAVPGASVVLRGGVVAYATDLKESVLGVDADLLAQVGAVDAAVAAQMAERVCRVLGSVWGVATTGVAGPTTQDGQPVGTVFVAVAGPGGTTVHRESFTGDRAAIRDASVVSALGLLRHAVAGAEETG